MASTVSILFFVALSDSFGRKPLLTASLVIFAAGSIVGALAHNYVALIAGRTVQGLGGGGLLGLSIAVVTDMVPLRSRGKFYAYFSVVYAIGSISGPIVGGALTTAGQWRWIFW
jgi:MFS family permease